MLGARASVAVCLLGVGLAIAAPGDLDPDFGDAGLLSLKFSEFGHSATAVAQQADGKLLIVGLGDVVLRNDDDFIVARLNTNGALDAGFGVSGAAVADYSGFFDVPYAVVQQSDGKVVLAGSVGVSATASDLGLARFNSDGTLDATFGNGGWAVIDLGGDDEAAFSLIRQPGGRLVAAGYTNAGGTYRAAFVRVTGAGTLDASFGTAGTTLLDFGAGSQAQAYDLAPQSDGKLVSVGRVVSSASVSRIGIARLSANGISDRSFDSDGFLTLQNEGAFEDAFSVVIQPDDSIVTAGYESAQGAGHFNAVVRRLDADGVPDAAFGSGGKSIVDFGSESIFYELVAEPDGAIVATGYRLTGEFFPDLILARLDGAGELDTGFGIDGVAVADFGSGAASPYGVGYGVVRQADGKYVAVGNFNTGYMVVARFDDGTNAPGRIGLTNTFRSADETAASISYTVRRTGGRSGTVSVSYATTAGTAQPGADFRSISGALSWNDGEADDKTLKIDLVDDNDAETPETFTLSLSNPTGGAVLAANEGTAQILSSDGAGQLGFTFQLFDAPVAGTEGDVALTAPVFRINGSEGAISVSYSVKSGTATEGTDFVMSGTLSWADGENAAKRIRINYLEDTLAEGRETFRIELHNPTGGATLHSRARFQDCIIEDNEPPPPPSSRLGLAETGAEIGEGGSVHLSVLRSGSSAGPVRVDYATSNGTATAGTDFTSESGTLSWADGDTANKTITVRITNDTTDESDETFSVTLFNPSAGTTLTNSALTVTIVDDDAPGGGGGSTLGFGSTAARIDEGSGSIVLTALRDGEAVGAVSVNYATSNGTATAGSDFAPATGTLHWADGDSSNKSISISVTDDGQNESDETLTLTLSNPSGAFLGSESTATVTITDNDPPIGGDGSSGGGGGGSSDRLFLSGLLLLVLARGLTTDKARLRQAHASGRPFS